MRLRARDESGASAVLFAALVASGLLFGLGALIVDLGMARDTRLASQIASDASALAAGNTLYPQSRTCAGGGSSPCLAQAVTAATTLAMTNYQPPAPKDTDRLKLDDFKGCAVPTGFLAANAYTCVTFNSLTRPTKVSVVMPERKVATPFASGNVSSVTAVNVQRGAEVSIRPARQFSCGLCVLGNVSTNNSDFTVTAGSIAVNGNISTNSQSYWKALDGQIQVAGTVNTQEPGQVTSSAFTPSPVKTPTFEDPYASLALPTVGALLNRSATTSCSNTTLQPGVYNGMNIGDACNLAAGMYIITGTWQEQNTHSVLSGSGVTLFFTCGTPTSVRTCTSADQPGTAGQGGRLDAKNGSVPITSGATGYADLALIYDRLNPNDIEVQGNGSTEITGAVYAANATMDFNGNSQFGVSGGPVVVKGVDGVGNPSGLSVTNSRDVTVSSVVQGSNLSK